MNYDTGTSSSFRIEKIQYAAFGFHASVSEVYPIVGHDVTDDGMCGETPGSIFEKFTSTITKQVEGVASPIAVMVVFRVL